MTQAPLLLTSEGQQQLLQIYRNGLLQDTLPFWFPRSIDSAFGGFLHCLDRDGTLVDSDKSIWVQGRMSWMLLTLYNQHEKNLQWLTWAESGLDFLAQHAFDTDGRMFFHVTQQGAPIRKRRYAYSESFAAIAYAAHARATGSSHSAERAWELLHHFTNWNFTPGLAPPKFTNTRATQSMGPRMITLVTAQELRANLGDHATLTQWIDRCIDEIARWFVKHELRVVMESVGPSGEIYDHFDGRTLNPGHAIEGAWFIMLEGKYRQDSFLVQLGCQMLDYMWERGWDETYGGIFYFRDVYHKPIQEYWQDMKFWWPHNETILATLLAYLLTGNEKYAQWHKKIHDWSYQHFADTQHGEWFGYLNRVGEPTTTLKGNLWKSFFHHPRMQWFAWQWLADAISSKTTTDSEK